MRCPAGRLRGTDDRPRACTRRWPREQRGAIVGLQATEEGLRGERRHTWSSSMSCSQRCAGSSCIASSARSRRPAPRGSRGGSPAPRTPGGSRAGCRRRRRAGGRPRARSPSVSYSPWKPKPVGPVEAVVVHLFERGLAVAAVVLVRRERRPLAGHVERLADDQALRGNVVGDDVVHVALPARCARGRAPRRRPGPRAPAPCARQARRARSRRSPRARARPASRATTSIHDARREVYGRRAAHRTRRRAPRWCRSIRRRR